MFDLHQPVRIAATSPPLAMTMMKEPFKPRATRSVTVTLILMVCMLGMLLHHRPFESSPTLRLRACGRVVLVSAARHGSTWFISSAEGCTAKDSPSFGTLNKQTELWLREGPVGDLTPAQAVEYVQRNKSIKILPVAYKREAELKEFLALVRRRVPVFVLRRRPEATFASLMHAKETGKWTRNTVDAAERGVRIAEQDEKKELFEKYKGRLEKYFKGVTDAMRDLEMDWDEVDYEDVSLQRVIVGERNGCYIKNCNY